MTIQNTHAQEAKQTRLIKGVINDVENAQPLPFVHIIASGKKNAATISNLQGEFAFQLQKGIDSLRFSCIGYQTKVFAIKAIPINDLWQVQLNTETKILKEVSIEMPDPVAIIKAAWQAIPINYDTGIYEQKGFFRETIKDSADYLSVAEAVFRMVSNPYLDKDKAQLQLIKGRSSEQVKATRLFEDFHPAGGPQITALKGLQHTVPSFLQPKQINKYEYFLADYASYEGHEVYKITFDQKATVKEALAKGEVLITMDNFAVVYYNIVSSPRGKPYTQHLKGIDKFFASLLNIDFKRINSESRVSFRKINRKWFLNDAFYTSNIRYKQEKKRLELDIEYKAALVMTDLIKEKILPISSNDQWQKNQMLLNLPGEWDAAFWGANNFITPESNLSQTVKKIQSAKYGKSALITENDSLWHHFNKKYFYTYKNANTLFLQPQHRCLWFRQGTGPMLYQNIQGNFEIELTLAISKRTARLQVPDNGFQSGGIIFRDPTGKTEEHLALWLGTRGSKSLKLSTQVTKKSKSNIRSEKTSNNTVHIKVKRHDSNFEVYFRWDVKDDWQMLIKEVFAFPDDIQFGLATQAHFAGNGPKMYPDILASFSNLKILASEDKMQTVEK